MADERIRMEELNRRLADSSIPERDLAVFFLPDEENTCAFKPGLRINPQTVMLPDDPGEARARSEAALSFANRICRMRRWIRFEQMLSDRYSGPVIVSEGDSWFQFPLLLADVIDHLYEQGFAIRSLGAAGDTLENMLQEREYREVIRETGATIFLLSAGGNDALGGGTLRNHLRDFDPNLSAAAHLLPSFDKLLDHAMSLYERVLRDVEALPGVITICHGYDRVIPHAGKWLGTPMESRGIMDPDFQRAIVGRMIDDFNDRLRSLAVRFGGRVRHVDVRGTVGNTLDDWYDELHPKSDGYGRVAGRFAEVIRRLGSSGTSAWAQREPKITGSRPSPSRIIGMTTRRGWSLHVGMNRIDPAHYGDEGELIACHFDARDMARIAGDRGFEKTKLLLDDQATRETVKQSITAAAAELKPGDLFLFTYAGHGSQIPDFNADETDGADETLCLFDAMLIDDELYILWSQFAADVRIVMISDCCHSGTLLRAMRRTATSALPSVGSEEARPRLLPLHIAARTFREHRDLYTAIGRRPLDSNDRPLIRELDMPLRGPLLLLSGCQDNQVSQDGIANGRFTQELLAVWDEGRFQGDWRRLHQRVVAGMPPNQTPNLMLIGRSPETLAAQSPFTI